MPRSAQKRPRKIGICTTSGPRQPTGFMPCSRYSFIVSWESFWRSFLYRSWSSFILGCTAVMAFMDRLCLMERGIIPARMMTVNMMIATPKLEKKAAYNSTRLLIMGRMITLFQISPRISILALGAARSAQHAFSSPVTRGLGRSVRWFHFSSAPLGVTARARIEWSTDETMSMSP